MKIQIHLLLCALGAAFLFGGQASPVRKPSPTNPFNYGVVAEGRVVPEGKIVHVTAHTGMPAVVATLLVKVNDEVKRGAPLATLQSKRLWDAQAQAARAQAAQAESELAQTKADNARELAAFEARTAALSLAAAAAKDEAAAATAAAQARLELVAAKLAQAQRTVADLTRERETLAAEQTAAVAAAQATLEATRAAKETKILKAQLEQANAASQRALLDFDRQLNAAKDGVAELQNELGIARRQDEAARARNALSQAEQALAAHTAQQAGLAASLELAQARAASAVAAAKAEVARAGEQAALGEIRAPQDGTILAIYAYPGESIGAEGLCEMANTSKLEIQAQVYIDDISRVKLGASATATGAGISGTLTGKVVEISRQVVPNTLFKLDPSAFSDQRIVLVRIALDEPARAARVLNAQVTVSIEP